METLVMILFVGALAKGTTKGCCWWRKEKKERRTNDKISEHISWGIFASIKINIK